MHINWLKFRAETFTLLTLAGSANNLPFYLVYMIIFAVDLGGPVPFLMQRKSYVLVGYHQLKSHKNTTSFIVLKG